MTPEVLPYLFAEAGELVGRDSELAAVRLSSVRMCGPTGQKVSGHLHNVICSGSRSITSRALTSLIIVYPKMYSLARSAGTW